MIDNADELAAALAAYGHRAVVDLHGVDVDSINVETHAIPSKYDDSFEAYAVVSYRFRGNRDLSWLLLHGCDADCADSEQRCTPEGLVVPATWSEIYVEAPQARWLLDQFDPACREGEVPS